MIFMLLSTHYLSSVFPIRVTKVYGAYALRASVLNFTAKISPTFGSESEIISLIKIL